MSGNIYDVSTSLQSAIKGVMSKNEDLAKRDLERRYGITHEEPKAEPQPPTDKTPVEGSDD